MIALGATLLAAPPAFGAPSPVVARIDVGRTHAPVSPYEYGMFIEPIGPLVARSLWAELLDDRKFWFPVRTPDKDPPPPPHEPGRPSRELRRWRPVGGPDVVAMDTSAPYAGRQDAAIMLDRATPRGIAQSGFGVARAKRYDGHVVVNAPPGMIAQAVLSWGDGPGNRQVVRLPSSGDGWQTLPFSFTAGADTNAARLEIVATGTGRLRIGTVSLMPADNIGGWRADTTAAARSLRSGFWRLPGGNFLSNWDWHEAIGPRDRRPAMWDEAWHALQDNDLGMDEWMALTRILGTEPYVTVNAGLGDAHSAADEVDYLNGPATSPWGARRAANGHPEPYHVRFWNIGNEPYGAWQIGVTKLDYYAEKHRRFAAAMHAVDPTITLIASGAMPDQEKREEIKQNLSPEDAAARYGTDEDWTGGLLAKAPGTFAGITEHWYDHEEKRPDAPPAAELMEATRQASNHVRMKAIEWQHYRDTFPAVDRDHIFLSIDEYAAFGTPNLRRTLAYGMVMNEMLRHTDFLRMSAFTTGISTMDITPTDAKLNAVGQLFRLYGEHLGAGCVPVEVDGDAPQPDPKYPAGFSHPRVKAGSPTYPLDVAAALTPDHRALVVAVVNATTRAQPLAIALTGAAAAGSGSLWRLTGPALDAENKVGRPDRVSIRHATAGRPDRLRIAPTSTEIYLFPLKTAS